ncbi:lysis protein [Amycolatopsis sp. WAC 01376]|uniref:C39 family peptidase n=1 Tax=Amycolatopsis sp. WAC 01376 TaxID=2203195 RepID=UPI000F774CEA|nr:C39 family peptidase [Amycolatopsis sp. WAC 01376]RSM66993.1 lysis protein [Amycolatopsis sp. WAC 01376]
MRRLRTAVVAALAVSALITAPAVAVAQGENVVAAPGFVNSMAPPAKVEGVRAAAELNIQYQIQETGYWCGPAATRIAISAKNGNPPSQQQLANELPTSTNGTDWIGQVTRVLNNHVAGGWYETKEMPNDPPTQAQRDLLWRDIVLDVDKGYAIVANIVAPANNHPPGYPNYTIYHYFTIIGYNSDNMTVKIADPANFGGNQIYWLTFNQLATLIPPKGYSA